MSTKVLGAEGSGDGSPGAKGTGPQSAGPAVSAEISAELASVAAALAQDEEEVFSEVPTEANRANPLASPDSPNSPDSIDKHAGQELAGAGAYRLVRPATSDRIDVHPTPSPDRPAPHRVVIGVARK